MAASQKSSVKGTRNAPDPTSEAQEKPSGPHHNPQRARGSLRGRSTQQDTAMSLSECGHLDAPITKHTAFSLPSRPPFYVCGKISRHKLPRYRLHRGLKRRHHEQLDKG